MCLVMPVTEYRCAWRIVSLICYRAFEGLTVCARYVLLCTQQEALEQREAELKLEQVRE